MDRPAIDNAFQRAQWLHREGNLRLAEATYRQVLELDRFHPGALHLLGLLALQCGKPGIAAELIKQATGLQPMNADAWNNLGVAYQKLAWTADAIAAHQRAIGLHPEIADFHSNLAKDFSDARRFSEAIAAFNRAVALRPVHADTQLNLSHALYRLGRHREALQAAQLAVTQQPDWHQAKYNLGSLLLLHGQLEQGFTLHEGRFEAGLSRDICTGPTWDGSPLDGRSILLNAEQGFGDTIQFCRYVPMVQERGGKVKLACQPELARVLRSLHGVEHVIPATRQLQADLHCPLMSLPCIFETKLSTIPSEVPYLRAEPTIASNWRQRVPADGHFRIGLAWSGRPADRDYIDRSIPVTSMTPLFEIPGTWFCSLQKNTNPDAPVTPAIPVVDWSSEVNDFADTAALIENMDLVISIDTAAAHLAGAMGKPVWLLLPHVPDYRWLLDREDSPWYPTMRLFRQTRVNSWDDLIENVRRELMQLLRLPPQKS